MKTYLNLHKVTAWAASTLTLLGVQLFITLQMLIQRFPAEDVHDVLDLVWYTSWEPLVLSSIMGLLAIATCLCIKETFGDLYNEEGNWACVNGPERFSCWLGAVLMVLPLGSFFASLSFGYTFSQLNGTMLLFYALDSTKVLLFIYYAIAFLRDYAMFLSFRRVSQARRLGNPFCCGNNEYLQLYAYSACYAQFDIADFGQFLKFARTCDVEIDVDQPQE